jgi:enoyl-CoA hydratase/carnithine racemase
MSEQQVLVEDRGHVRWLTLNRPEVMNAITGEMLGRLNEVLKAADDDPGTRVIVLTGAGRGFCSGLDLKQAAQGEGIGGAGLASAGARHYSTREICTVTLQRMDTPVIAVINGVAAGYGLDLALGCDMRLMSDRAMLMPGFAKMGVIPESGGTWYLPRLLGWAKACEVSMLGDNLNAAQAEGYGLVNKAVAADELNAEATRWSEKIAGNAPLAITEMKRLFRHGLTQDFESHSHHVLMSILNLFKSEDFREGVQSFAEKRSPEFKGR